MLSSDPAPFISHRSLDIQRMRAPTFLSLFFVQSIPMLKKSPRYEASLGFCLEPQGRD